MFDLFLFVWVETARTERSPQLILIESKTLDYRVANALGGVDVGARLATVGIHEFLHSLVILFRRFLHDYTSLPVSDHTKIAGAKFRARSGVNYVDVEAS
jgi:hypothetical protein